MATKYEIQNGDILREGVKIATRADDGTVDYLPGMARFRAPVMEFLKEQGFDKPPAIPPEVAARMKAPRVAGEKPEVPAPSPEPETVTTNPEPIVTTSQSASADRVSELEAENARLRAMLSGIPAAPAAAPSAVVIPPSNDLPAFQQAPGMVRPSITDSAVDPVKLRTYPDAPPYDPAMGDKTPAFFNWLAKNHPQDAQKRYFGRKLPGGKLIEEIIAEQANR